MDSLEGRISSSSKRGSSSSSSHRQLAHFLATRKLVPYSSQRLATIIKNHSPFLYQLNLMKKLPVHDGCVNTICWNDTGEYILSGSDDRSLCVTKPANLFDYNKNYTVVHKIQTHHLGNIFCARFLPNSSIQKIVSCSSDGPVIVHDVNSTDPSQGIFIFNCHSSTIYDVVTLPDEPQVFLSCSEDKSVRLFDMRCHKGCSMAGTCPHPPLIRNSRAITTLTAHPLNSNLLLVGRTDGTGLIYDRRRLPDPASFSRERAHAERLAGETPSFKYMHPLDGVVSQFSAEGIDSRSRFTSLIFSPNGSQILASYSQDYIYLFNHDKSSNLELIQTLPKKVQQNTDDQNSDDKANENRNSSSSKSTRGRRLPQLRFRGDWSDTGINSVPMSILTGEGGSGRNIATRNEFLLRFNELFSGRIAGESRDSPGPEIVAVHAWTRRSRGADDSGENERSSDVNMDDDDDEDDDDDGDEDDDSDDMDDDDDDDDDVDEEVEEEECHNNGDEYEEDESDNESHYVEMRSSSERAPCLSDNNVQASHSAQSSRTSNDDRTQNQPKVSPQTRLKFKNTVDRLKDKYSSIPSFKPHVKYQGHRNSRTCIKKATFWGDRYIMSGSDCGRIMIWEKDTAKLVMGFPADERVVNCLAPHPQYFALASSGIDYDIKLWSTQDKLERPLMESPEKMDSIVRNNELMLEEAKQTVTVPPHWFFRALASYAASSITRD